jgi:hypothetical protein
MCFCYFWKVVSGDSIGDANQTSGVSIGRGLRPGFMRAGAPPKEYRDMQMEYIQIAMAHRWSINQAVVNRYQGYLETIHMRDESGKSPTDLVFLLFNLTFYL